MQFAIIIKDAYPFTSDVKVIRLPVLAMFAPHTRKWRRTGRSLARSLAVNTDRCMKLNGEWSRESHYSSEIIGCWSSRASPSARYPSFARGSTGPSCENTCGEQERRTRGGEEEGSVTKAPAYGESERMETASTVRSKKSHGVCYGHSGPSGRYSQITRSFA